VGWIKLDDNFCDHPKVTEAGPAAAWLYVAGLTFCSRFLTDGFIPEAQIARLTSQRNPKGLRDILVKVGLWDEADGGVQVHNYTQWQSSSEHVLGERAKAKLRRARGALASGERRATGTRASGERRRLDVEEKYPLTPNGAGRTGDPTGRRPAPGGSTEPPPASSVAAAERRRSAEMEAAADCDLCDELGGVQDGTGAVRCQHESPVSA
jgi:hypothetical protein